ncbi:MAG: M42 family metallopeptidase [Akkermansiaceae bacterium]|nr:M42 family metallopeptidase [Akkermansiaceae bacterium]
MTRFFIRTAGTALVLLCTAAASADNSASSPLMFNKDLLEKCSNASGVSGFEDEIRSVITAELAGCGTITHCRNGNLICEKPGPEGSPCVALVAHMDEIGFMVQGVTADGFLLLVPLGGWWNHTLPSQRVQVMTRDGRKIPGQIGTKPPHLLPESQRKQVMPDDALFVDVGASSKEEVEALGIRLGCCVVPDVQLQALGVEHRWMGKAFDNRAGVYTMIRTMQAIKDMQLPCTVRAIATVQEEVGTRGARALQDEKVPDFAIILEGPPADDTLGQSTTCRQGELGKGVQIRLYDPTNITPPAFADFVLDTAARNGIRHQATVRRTGGTDAAASYPNWHGTPSIVFGVPTRYIHSHNGILDTRDLSAAVQLTIKVLENILNFGK